MASNYWLRSVSYTMLQRGTTFLFGFTSYLLLIRYMSIDDFGVWTLYVVVSGAAEMSRSAFIQNAFLKFYNEVNADKPGLFRASFTLNTLSTLVFVVILAGLTPVLGKFWHSDKIGSLLLWYCATAIVLIPLTQFNYLEQANHHFKGVFWATFVRQFSFFVIVAIWFFFFPDYPMQFFAGAHTFCAFLGLVTSYTMTRQYFPPRVKIQWPEVGRLFRFGKYILGTGITSTIGKNADQVILGAVSHPLVAIYNAASRVLNFIEVPTLSISNVVYPKMAASASEDGNRGVSVLYAKSVASIVGLILPFVVFALLFPEFVLTIIAGERYISAALPLRILLVASLLLPFNVQIGSVCEVINKPQVSFYINLAGNILNVVLNIILIHFYGMIGAAVTFLATVVFIFALGQYYVRSRFEVGMTGIVWEILGFYRRAIAMGMKKLKTS
ncbi:MAG TPA: flippase [Cyclobacteriaceae bacterium]|nr:flippase [Cyclobacteriaceae bacterium]